jgi:hypothetical protein
VLNAFRRHNAFASRRLETLQPGLGLQRATTECRKLVTEMLHKLLELRERGCFRTYAV